MRLTAALLAVLLLSACASAPPITTPEWDSVPPHVVEALCRRLRMDAVATGELTIVRVTQPLATPDLLTALGLVSPRGSESNEPAPVVQRAIPIATTPASCKWNPVDVRDIDRHHDAMLVELSSPIVNPYVPSEAGLFARVSLGGEADAWYWIPVVPTERGWVVRPVSVIVK
ncbi:MAG: hypothetical protein ACLGH0_14815 [Thermoanaerobaculia bacterium]